MTIRFATYSDSPAIRRIYAQYIETPITFEYTLPDEQEMAARIGEISSFYPYLVCTENNNITGYAYAHRHMAREAYQWNAELTVYLDRDFTSQGLGKQLYQCLIEILKLQGIRTVYGGVTAQNTKSEAFHAALGFHVIGTYSNAGYKDGKWHDVTWYGKQIAPYGDDPQTIISLSQVPEDQLRKILVGM